MMHGVAMSKSVGEQVEQVRLERRSPLFRWLYEHHDELAPVLNKTRPPWAATAVTFARSKGGKVVSRQAVKMAWPMVKEAKGQTKSVPARARVEISAPNPFPVEGPPRDDDDFQLHDVMGRPIK